MKFDKLYYIDRLNGLKLGFVCVCVCVCVCGVLVRSKLKPEVGIQLRNGMSRANSD